jgi:hypothetical protein
VRPAKIIDENMKDGRHVMLGAFHEVRMLCGVCVRVGRLPSANA